MTRYRLPTILASTARPLQAVQVLEVRCTLAGHPLSALIQEVVASHAGLNMGLGQPDLAVLRRTVDAACHLNLLRRSGLPHSGRPPEVAAAHTRLHAVLSIIDHLIQRRLLARQ